MSLPDIRDENWQQGDLSTPAFVYDEGEIVTARNRLCRFAATSGSLTLFALKSLSFADAIVQLVPPLDGFSVSSLFEAKLARDLCGDHGLVHITTPAYPPAEIDEIAKLCDHVTLNSLSQWEGFRHRLRGRARCGLRVNPQLPLLKDDRYNPCRLHSKLGVPLKYLTTLAETAPSRLTGISGLHFHTNCDSSDFNGLLATVRHLDGCISPLLRKMQWINLGGGYLLDETDDLDPFYDAIDLLRSKYSLQVFIEPGAAVVRNAGYLVSTVLDIFDSDGKMVAILDTSVNHMPEVFEYQFEPDVLGDVEGGQHEYVLAGCSCLAGDLFGEYAFDEPLEVGSRIVFANVGAYTLVKALMFNGINLPTIYVLKENGTLVMVKRFTYEDFAARCGVNTRVLI